METTHTTQIALALRSMVTVIRNYSHVCASHYSRRRLFRSELQPLFEAIIQGAVYSVQSFRLCGYYSRWHLFQEIRYVKFCTRLSPPFCTASAKKLGGGLESTRHLFSICSIHTIIRTQVQPSTAPLVHDHSDADDILHFKDGTKCEECKTIFAKSKLN